MKNMKSYGRAARIAVNCLLIAAVLISSLVLVQVEPADAQVGPSCSQGVLDGNVCVTVGAPPTTADICPVSQSVVEIEGECLVYRKYIRTECTAPYQPLLDGMCVFDIGFVATAPSDCPSTGVPGSMSSSTTQNELGFTTVCEQGPFGDGICPGTSVPNSNAPSCKQDEPLVSSPVCEVGFELVNNDTCIQRVLADNLTATCAQGLLVVDTCREFGDSPALTGPYCAISDTVIMRFGGCFTVEDSVSGFDCPVGQTYDISPLDDTPRCLQPVPPVPSLLWCGPDGFFFDGDACVRITAANISGGLDCFGPVDVPPACFGQLVIGPLDIGLPDLPEIFLPIPVALRPGHVTYFECPGGVGTFEVVATARDEVVVAGDLIELDGRLGQYDANIVGPESGQLRIDLSVVCPGGEERVASRSLDFAAPAGLVVDCVGQFIEGAVMTLERSESAAGPFAPVATGDTAVLDPIQLDNPTMSDVYGLYRWHVVADGYYRVIGQIAGQPRIESSVLSVPPQQPWVDFVFRQQNCSAEPCSATFVDVASPSFYDDAVDWAACTGVTTGTSLTTFSPNDTVTRAQLATFLWRYAGRPTGYSHPFVDVASPSYYEEAVAWMAANEITTGTSDTTFSPNDPVTRAQMATFLWRFQGEPIGFTHPFVDVQSPSYYEDGVAWMAANGITNGTSDTTFSPLAPLTRAQAVTFLFRYNNQQ